MRSNASLVTAKRARDDEFYTTMHDIAKELRHHEDAMRGKRVLCLADDPDHSQFVRYFTENFDRLGLASLTATHLARDGKPARKHVVTADGVTSSPLDDDGDFRSPEVVALLDDVDVVVTNPPFTLLRDLVTLLVEHDTDFLLMAPQGMFTRRVFFDLVAAGVARVGYETGTKTFTRPDGTLDKRGNVIWFTTLPVTRQPLPALCFPQYVDHDAIDVSHLDSIPADYDGVIGVPITLLNHHDPRQFEILDLVNPTVRNADGELVRKYSRVLIRRVQDAA